MNLLLTGALLLGFINFACCTACDSCITTYDTEKTTSGSECTALKSFLTCLDSSANSDAGCPPSNHAAVGTDYTTNSCSFAAANSICECQKTYWGTDLSASEGACTAAKQRISCLRGKPGTACDGSTKSSILATKTETDMGALTSPVCSVPNTSPCSCEIEWAKADISTTSLECSEVKKYIACLKGKTGMGCDGTTSATQLATAAETHAGTITGCSIDASSVCKCDVDYAKADISDDTKKCTAYKDYISCLHGKTGTGCDGSTSLKDLAIAAKDAITSIGSSCTKTDVCDCEIAYAIADVGTGSKKCTAVNALTTCIMASTQDGCGASTKKSDVGTVVQQALTALTPTNCAVTATCQCQVDFNKASLTDADKCASGKAVTQCLSAITSTTETGCDATTKAAALQTQLATVEAALCSSAGLQGSIVFASLMLIAAALVTSP